VRPILETPTVINEGRDGAVRGRRARGATSARLTHVPDSSCRTRRRPPAARRLLAGLCAALLAGCGASPAASGTAARDRAIADTLRALVVDAYSLADSNVVRRFMSLYPARGRVVSATGGQVTASRDTIRIGVERFYDRVGRNMRDPVWEWGPMYVDVLSADAAVLTAEYRIPHRTPEGAPHTIAGAWTAVFARRAGRWGVVQEHLSDAPAAP
jgi:hypothetical protein